MVEDFLVSLIGGNLLIFLLVCFTMCAFGLGINWIDKQENKRIMERRNYKPDPARLHKVMKPLEESSKIADGQKPGCFFANGGQNER